LKHPDEVLLQLLLGGKDEKRNQKIKEIIKDIHGGERWQ